MASISAAITGEQIRAARALGRVDQIELAKRSGLSIQTVKRLESIRGPIDANISTFSAIVHAFDLLGISFQPQSLGGGVFLSSVSSDQNPN